MSDLSANEEMVNREEINIECFDKSINNLKFPRVQVNLHDYYIETLKRIPN